MGRAWRSHAETIKRVTVMAVKSELTMPNDKVTEIREWLETAGLPHQVDVTFKGEDEEQAAAQSFLVKISLGSSMPASENWRVASATPSSTAPVR